MKITTPELDKIDFSRMEHLDLTECPNLVNLDFLQRIPKLKHLNVNYCIGARQNAGGLRHVRKLTVLKMRGVIPFFVSQFINILKISFYRVFAFYGAYVLG